MRKIYLVVYQNEHDELTEKHFSSLEKAERYIKNKSEYSECNHFTVKVIEIF